MLCQLVFLPGSPFRKEARASRRGEPCGGEAARLHSSPHAGRPGDERRQELVFTWRAKQHNKASTTQPEVTQRIKAAPTAGSAPGAAQVCYRWAASSPPPAAGGHGAGVCLRSNNRCTTLFGPALPLPCQRSPPSAKHPAASPGTPLGMPPATDRLQGASHQPGSRYAQKYCKADPCPSRNVEE